MGDKCLVKGGGQMSNYSDFKEGAEQLNQKMTEAMCSENERRVHVGLFYLGELTRSMAKMADDIHKISKTLDEMNRRRV